MLPLAGSTSNAQLDQDFSVAEEGLPTLDLGASGTAESSGAVSSEGQLITQSHTTGAATSPEQSTALDAVADGGPATLQLFIVGEESADDNPVPSLGNSSSKKRRRSSGVRRTLLAQLQVCKHMKLLS